MYYGQCINYNRQFYEAVIGYYVALNDDKTITYNPYVGVALGKFSATDIGGMIPSTVINCTKEPHEVVRMGLSAWEE